MKFEILLPLKIAFTIISNKKTMKKNFFLILSMIMSGTVAMAQPVTKKVPKESKTVQAPALQMTSVAPVQELKQEDKKTGEVLWLNEASHDFGKIPQGKPVTTEFELKNTGKDSLNLEMVQAGCGCTTPVWTKGSYAPGANFKITVGYNAAAEGAFTKAVTITYNGGQQKVINITGTVYSTPSTPAPQNNGLGKVQN